MPFAFGVPVIALVAGSSTSPGGSEPVFTVHMYGGTPPVAVRLRTYDEPAVASGSGDAVVIDRLDVTASVNCLDAVTELLSVTWTANAKVPPCVGTPEIMAVPALKESPAGSPPEMMLQSNGGVPPVAAPPEPTVAPAPGAPSAVPPTLLATDAAAQPAAAPATAPATASAEPQHISIDDFVKVDLRVAQILVAERVPKADKLLRLEVDLGYEKRQILAGIAQFYEPEKLIGRKIVIVANLAPRKMRGLESNGMLLAASLPDGAPVLAGFLEEVPLGARLK